MKKLLLIFLLLQVISPGLSSQNNNQFDHIEDANLFLNKQFYSAARSPQFDELSNKDISENSFGYHYFKTRKKIAEIASPEFYNDVRERGDTIIIGDVPGEELIITSDWMASGVIIVMNDGLLWIKNATATFLGDVFLIGYGQMMVDSSTLFFPQEYFYQRQILITDYAKMHVKHSTMDFGGLTNNLALVGNGRLILQDVVKPDFSTIGLYDKSTIHIDGIDLAGEFICDDQTSLNIKNAETVLVWHRFSEGSSAELDFPDGDLISNYTFDNTLPDISGIAYNIHLENCKTVWWGLMPSKQTEITIRNSEMRIIGLWFEGSDTSNVSGLVNNSTYSDQEISLDDRMLRLIDTKVNTWSIYTFDDVKLDLESSIIGEIGVMGRSFVEGLSYYCDGNGGYVWGTDTPFLISGFSSIASSFRSQGHGIAILAYSNLINGNVYALENSVLMLIQSYVPEKPYLDNNACIWMANIEGPSSMIINNTHPIRGSAWIDKGPTSLLMDFDHYEMFYQSVEDTTVWHPIGEVKYNEVSDDVLIHWNTNGLVPGGYNLKLRITDDDENSMEAMKAITLLPEILGVDSHTRDLFTTSVLPNPASGAFTIRLKQKQSGQISMRLYNLLGEEMLVLVDGYKASGTYSFSLDASSFPKGLYLLRTASEGKTSTRKIVLY